MRWKAVLEKELGVILDGCIQYELSMQHAGLIWLKSRISSQRREVILCPVHSFGKTTAKVLCPGPEKYCKEVQRRIKKWSQELKNKMYRVYGVLFIQLIEEKVERWLDHYI